MHGVHFKCAQYIKHSAASHRLLKVLLPPGASPWLPITRQAAQPSQNGGGPVVGVPDVHLETQSIQQRALSCQDDLLKVGEEFHILHVFQRFRIALVPAQGSQILLNFSPIRRYKPHSITLAAADVTKMSAWQPMRQICSSDKFRSSRQAKATTSLCQKGRSLRRKTVLVPVPIEGISGPGRGSNLAFLWTGQGRTDC